MYLSNKHDRGNRVPAVVNTHRSHSCFFDDGVLTPITRKYRSRQLKSSDLHHSMFALQLEDETSTKTEEIGHVCGKG